MSTQPFTFKEFIVHQDRCAMKIGTDGVLLGAWAPLDHRPFNILDIGTGTGVIALMLAQRSTAEMVDALEIDDDAYEQAVDNFEASIWNDRLFCYHASFNEFVEEIEDKYDLIISNPPFYSEDYKTSNEQRDMARFSDALPFEHLVYGTAQLLSETGKAAFIIPFKEEERFIALAKDVDLYPEQITRVKGTPDTAIVRSLLCFSATKKAVKEDELIIELARHEYTKDYIALTKSFYLKM